MSWAPHSTHGPRDPRALRPVDNRPTVHGARARWRTWRSCLRGQRATRSTPCRWPKLFFTDTAPRRRLWLRKGRGHRIQPLWCAASARFPLWRTGRRPTEHARAEDVVWLSSWPTRNAFHPTPLAETHLHRHCAMSVSAASNRRHPRVQPSWCVARARFALLRTGRRSAEYARAGGIGVVVFAVNMRRAPHHAVGRDSSS